MIQLLLLVIVHQYVHVIVPVLGQVRATGNICLNILINYEYMSRMNLIDNIEFSCSKNRYKLKRSPSHIRNLLPSVLPMKEFHNYHRHDEAHQSYDQYQTTMDESHLLLHHHNDGAYLFNVDFNSVIESRTQTTLLQHNLGPPDLPPLYQPQHRASI